MSQKRNRQKRANKIELGTPVSEQPLYIGVAGFEESVPDETKRDNEYMLAMLGLRLKQVAPELMQQRPVRLRPNIERYLQKLNIEIDETGFSYDGYFFSGHLAWGEAPSETAKLQDTLLVSVLNKHN